MATLYLNGIDTEAKLAGRTFQVSKLNEETGDIDTMKVPLFDLDRVVVAGRPAITVPMLQACAREGVPVAFVTSRGRWVGNFVPDTNGHALRRLRQYDLARDETFALKVAKCCVGAKIRNGRRVLQRLAANRGLSQEEDQVAVGDDLQATLSRAENASDLDTLRGYEGVAAAIYFRRLGIFFPAELPFNGRNRRPPRDEANAILSWTYIIVLGEIDAAVRAAGLDPCLGFLHGISHGRSSPALCDLLVLNIVNHGILKAEHFEPNAEDGGVYMKKDARKIFFTEYERTMLRRFSPAKGEAHTDFRGIIRAQVNALLRAMETLEPEPLFQMP
ncbi:MAG: CRISPR-associated endonuclease Cas1 [Lentisphaeria bacterium]|nr:CRISPR-associated endonuclease Cas1 [Lentisphaeria bacterium]